MAIAGKVICLVLHDLGFDAEECFHELKCGSHATGKPTAILAAQRWRRRRRWRVRYRLYRLYHLSQPLAGKLSGNECRVATAHPKIFRASGRPKAVKVAKVVFSGAGLTGDQRVPGPADPAAAAAPEG